MSIGVAALVLQAIARDGFTWLGAGISVASVLLAGLIVPGIAYAIGWLSAPHKMILEDIAALRGEIGATQHPAPVIVDQPERSQPTAIEPMLGVEFTHDQVRLTVENIGPVDAEFVAQITGIRGCRGDFDVPLALKWEGSSRAAQLIHVTDAHAVDFARLRSNAEGYGVYIPSPNRVNGNWIDADLIAREGHHELYFTIDIKAQGYVTVGGVMRLRLQVQDVDDGLALDAEILP